MTEKVEIKISLEDPSNVIVKTDMKDNCRVASNELFSSIATNIHGVQIKDDPQQHSPVFNK
jgi:hypothetical protein